MEKALETLIKDFVKKFGAQDRSYKGQVSLLIAPENLTNACQELRDTYRFEMLAGQTAVDYWPELDPRFHVVYEFNSLSKELRLELRVPLTGNAPSLASISSIYSNANWYEREIWDMFGITFEGHPDLRRLIMPYDWEGHPLRKDYPLGYEEVQFSFNFEEIDQRKPKPKE